MHPSFISFAIVLLVEAITAVIDYLKNKLMAHLHRNDRYDSSFA